MAKTAVAKQNNEASSGKSAPGDPRANAAALLSLSKAPHFLSATPPRLTPCSE